MSFDTASLNMEEVAETGFVSGLSYESLARKRMKTETATQKQRTIAHEISCSGIGLHSGEISHLRLTPAPEDTGIVFIRTDLLNGARHVAARWDTVVDTKLCTVIGNKAGTRVATIEHLMAALHAMGIDNAFVEIDRAEVPMMDGSAAPYVAMIESAGTQAQDATRKIIEILSPIEVVDGQRFARLSPASESRLTVDIAFARAPINSQTMDWVLSSEGFKREISKARTFGFFEEVDQLRKLGLARGGSLDNAIVIKGDSILNEGGLRYANEFARHKLLDAVGDLALAGGVIRGHFEGRCSGHAMNNRLLHALFETPSAWRYL
ncbi:MAG: UDP-3-O-acyl-N-acetylglucosamine deacetylase [Bdellovibrionales bacterium]